MSTLAKIFGVIFVLVGVLGFIPNPLVGASGLFETDLAHNLVHIVLGAVLFMWANSAGLKVVGIVYLLVAVLGFVMGEGMLLGLVHINAADNWLHVVLGLVLVGAGLMGGKSSSSVPMQPMQ